MMSYLDTKHHSISFCLQSLHALTELSVKCLLYRKHTAILQGLSDVMEVVLDAKRERLKLRERVELDVSVHRQTGKWFSDGNEIYLKVVEFSSHAEWTQWGLLLLILSMACILFIFRYLGSTTI